MFRAMFSDKGAKTQIITLIEENETMDSNVEIYFIFNKHFSNIVFSLSILRYKCPFVDFENIEDPFDLLREKYKNHPSVFGIHSK